MKKIIFLLFIFQLTTAQNLQERNKIKQSYNKEKVNNFIVDVLQSHKEQQKRIKAYKLKFKLLESETGSLQRIYDGLPFFYTIENDESVITIRGNSLQPNGDLGLNLTGSGITAGVWDGGKVRETHQELSGSKIEFGDGATSFSAHSTHVTGTICAKGVVARARGFAYQAKAKTYFWDNDVAEMASFGADGFLVSNHSYGYGITNSFSTSRFGYYDQTSADFDKISEVFPYYQIVIAAGNSRNSSHPQIIAKGGFDMLSGSAVSKNAIVVAAVNSVPSYTSPSSVTMSSFSNYGPTDDGRIKPDISAKGVAVYSCNFLTDTTYETLSGTSMAAPAITGLIVLLQQHYNNLNQVFMKAATVRGLLCHTADEAGASKGPDYEYGWGLANGKEAAKIISANGTSALILETSLNDKAVFTREVTIGTSRPLVISIAWTDPVGVGAVVIPVTEDSRTPHLVNNLDLKVIDDSGTVYYPWKLDPSSLNNPATQNSDNNVDNIEKVYIENAPAGKYTIQVTHKGVLQNGTQDFSLIAQGFDSLTLGASDFARNDGIRLYPNPSKENLFFDLPFTFAPKEIMIYDLMGKLIRTFKYEQKNNLKISDLNSGLYIIKFVSEDKTITSKFLKE
jgi:subtilisin family serine protease